MSKINETTIDLFWQLLRSYEEKIGNSAGPLDAELIRASYRHFSVLTGKNLRPSYVKESNPEVSGPPSGGSTAPRC